MQELHTIPAKEVARWWRALPFWASLALVPLAWLGATQGGWTVILLPVVTWYLFAAIDAALGLDTGNADPETPEAHLAWYTAVTRLWPAVQAVTLFGLLWYVPRAAHLGTLETVVLFFGVGVMTGTIGINYAHELMHQRNRPSAGWATSCWRWCSTRTSGPSTCWCITATSARRATR